MQDAATLTSIRGFKLHSDDSWRQFLLAKFHAANRDSGDDWKALVATVGLLQGYLNAFTTHTPYNLDEFGDNYLARTFPRAMTGQLIHDCGVYALRVAYMLSLVREELHLTFRAAIMPVHVGLVISFGADVSKGALYVNNNSITVMPGTASTVPGEQQTTLSDLAGRSGRPPTRRAAAQERAAFRRQGAARRGRRGDVHRRSGRPGRAGRRAHLAAEHLDGGQQATALGLVPHADQVAGDHTAVKGTPQPELLYLGQLERLRSLHNQIRVPAYLRAHKLFTDEQPRLRAAAATSDRPTRPHTTAPQAVLHAIHEALVKIFQPLTEARTKASIDAGEINEFMRTHPTATGPPAQLRPAIRLNLSVDPEIERYLGTPGAPACSSRARSCPPAGRIRRACPAAATDRARPSPRRRSEPGLRSIPLPPGRPSPRLVVCVPAHRCRPRGRFGEPHRASREG